MRKKRNLAIIGLILLLAFLFMLPFVIGGYLLYVVTLTIIFILAVMGYNILIGYTGVIALAHASFFAVGAYATAILMNRASLPFLLSLLLAGFIAAVIGIIVGLPALRLSGFYLAVATLGFSSVMGQIIVHWNSMTGGSSGLTTVQVMIPGLESIGYTENTYLIVLLITIVMFVFTRNLIYSRVGRNWMAIRESDIGAAALGVNVAAYKLLAFAVSGFYAAIAGGMYGQVMGFINPEQFTDWVTIKFLAMVVIGGMGSIVGSVVGASVLMIIPELLQDFQFLQNLIYGIIMMLMIALMPKGIVSIPELIRQRKGLSLDHDHIAKFFGINRIGVMKNNKTGSKGG